MFFATAICVYAQQNLIDLSTGESFSGTANTRPEVEITKSEDNVKVCYKFSYVGIQEGRTESSVILDIAGFGHNSDGGKPDICGYTNIFDTPKNSHPSVTLTSANYIELDIELSPAQESYVYSQSENPLEPIGDYDGFYPNEVISTTYTKTEPTTIFDVRINPIQYNCRTKKTRIYTDVSYTVDYNALSVSSDFVAGNEHIVEDAATSQLNDFVLVPVDSVKPVINNLPTRVKENEGYLIVTSEQLGNVANKFADWKKQLGFDTYTIKITSIGRQDTVMTNAKIQQAISEHPQIKYLLFIGDNTHVPAYKNYFRQNGKAYPYSIDLYYGSYTGASPARLIPKIARGRLPMKNAEEAETIIDKIIQYERNPIEDESFYKTGINASYFEKSPASNMESSGFVQRSEMIRNMMMRHGYDVNRIYNIRKTYTNSSKEVVSCTPPLRWSNGDTIPAELQNFDFYTEIGSYDLINKGASYYLYNSHGNTNNTCDIYFTTPVVKHRLNNGSKLSTFFFISCYMGAYDYARPVGHEDSTEIQWPYDDENITHALLNKKDGGAAAVISASVATYVDGNHHFGPALFERIWPDDEVAECVSAKKHEPVYRLGDAMDQAIISVIEHFGLRDISAKNIAEAYHVYGDPAMSIRTENPEKIRNVRVSFKKGSSNDVLLNVQSDNGKEYILLDTTDDNAQPIKYLNGIANFSVKIADIDSYQLLINGVNKTPYITRLSDWYMNIGIGYPVSAYLDASSNMIHVKYQLPTNASETSIAVYDTDGNFINSSKTPKQSDNLEISAQIPVKDSNKSYIVALLSGDTIIKSIIIK